MIDGAAVVVVMATVTEMALPFELVDGVSDHIFPDLDRHQHQMGRLPKISAVPLDM